MEEELGAPHTSPSSPTNTQAKPHRCDQLTSADMLTQHSYDGTFLMELTESALMNQTQVSITSLQTLEKEHRTN